MTTFFVNVGVGELTHLWWLPLGLGLLLKAMAEPTWRRWAWVSVAMVGAVLSCFYLGFFLGVAVGIVCAWHLLVNPDRLLYAQRMAFAAGLLIVIVLPIGRVFAISYAAPSFDRDPPLVHIFAEKGQQVTDTLGSRLDPTQLFAYGRVATTEHELGYGGGRYLGLAVTLLALFGVIRRPREALPWLLVALMAIWFSIGSYLTMGGEEVRMVGGGRVRMPMLWLNRILELIAEPVNFPVRFLALAVMAQSALVALAVSKTWGKWLTVLVPVGALEIAAGQLIAWPWPTLQIYRRGRSSDWPTTPAARSSTSGSRFRPMRRTVRWPSPVRCRISTPRTRCRSRESSSLRRRHTLARSMHIVDDINGLYYHEDPRMADDYREDLTMLKEQGFDILLISTKDGRRNIPERAFEALNKLCGMPIADGPGGVAWEIKPVQPTPTPRELEVWRQNLQIRVKDWERKLKPMQPGP